MRQRSRAAVVALGLLLVATSLAAQATDSARVGVKPGVTPPRPAAPRTAVVRDSFAPPISPKRAFLYSLMVPGLGQSRLARPTAGGVYVAFELTAITMLGKSRYDLGIAKRRVKESIVKSYKVDVSGVPLLDTLGRPVVNDTLGNRYAISGNDQLRSRLKARRLHYEDWVAMLAFTHLFAGADAFVSAHLWDLPKQVEFRRLPSGAAGIGARLPFR